MTTQYPIAIACLALTAAIHVNAAPKKWDNDPKGIKVFILAGQSNMVGYGKTEMGGNPEWKKGDKSKPKEIKAGKGCLREMAINDTNYPELSNHL